MNTENAKIAERSRKALTDALLTVLQCYEYNEVTITQLTQEAGLSRRTFYRLFSDKSELLDALFKRHSDKIFGIAMERGITDYWELVRAYFDYWESQRDLLLLLKERGLLYMLHESAYKNSYEMFSLLHTGLSTERFSDELPYMFAYSIGGMNSMLVKWAEDGMSIPSRTFIDKLEKGLAARLI